MTSQQPSHRTLATLLLLAVVALWGGTFVLVKDALRDASPLLFTALRMAIASAVLLLLNRRSLRRLSPSALRGGLVAGLLLAAGYGFQTVGLARTTAIKSAFLTGLVVVLVPLLSFFPALRRPGVPRPGSSALLGALLAFAGLVLLTTPSGLAAADLLHTISLGDALTLACAFAFAGHLLSLSRLTHLPAPQFATLQILAATLALALSLPFSPHLHLHPSPTLFWALGITGIFATAAAFSIQTWAQQHLSATTVALLLTLEPVFALLVSLLFLGERLSFRGSAGAALILSGIAVTELLALPHPTPIEPV